MTTASSDGAAQHSQARDTRFFGHPAGLGVLGGTELWERFSFYGMQALLMLYMTKQLLLPGHVERVWGLDAYRGALDALFGPTSDLAFAAQTFGIYSGLLYATPLIGAWLADRKLGKTRTITIGALMMTGGHLAMASERLFLIALALLVIGGGLVIGNLAAQVGQLYAPDDERRTRAFGLYLIALNVGALLAPLIIGTLGEKVGWHYGFGAAGIGMLVGLATYLWGRRFLPPDRIVARGQRVRLTPAERRRVLGVLLNLIPYILVTTALQQAYGIMYVWADTAVDLRIFGWAMPVTWIGVFDGVMTIVSVIVATSIWKRLAERGREPGDVTKLAIGCLIMALGYAWVAAVARLPVAPLWTWLLFFVIADFSIAWQEAPTASVTSRAAPAPVNATMMAIFKLASAVSYFAIGWMGRFYEPLGPSAYWLLLAGVALGGWVFLLLFGRAINRLMAVEGERG